MMIVLITFAAFVAVMAMMAVGVIFGRQAIKGSCGGTGANCVCVKKCDKRKAIEAAKAQQSLSSES
ncbi:MAG: (Na+)-NQR maturation NqrM [Methylococcales bacterium]|nr:(Na+)-NQR maturation NqrM [Methylococcales bacterium]